MSDLESSNAVLLPLGNVLMTCVLVGKVGSLLPVAVTCMKMCRTGIECCYGSMQSKTLALSSGWSCLSVRWQLGPDYSYKYTTFYSLCGNTFIKSLQFLRALGHSGFALCWIFWLLCSASTARFIHFSANVPLKGLLFYVMSGRWIEM